MCKKCCGFGNSDIVLIYTIKEYGGAYEAKRYAKKQNKEIIEIPGKMSNFRKAVLISNEKWIDSLNLPDTYEL